MRLNNNLSLEQTKAIYDLHEVATDLIASICGERIGFGCYRSVFEYNIDPKYVVKVELGNTSCNLMEYYRWEEIKRLTGKREWIKD
jgi:hypothetical protein